MTIQQNNTGPDIPLPTSPVLLHHEILSLIGHLRKLVTHPYSAKGWFCSYKGHMKYLLSYLATKPLGDTTFWHSFREEASIQISSCRQCSIAYHSVVVDWEVDILQKNNTPPSIRDQIKALRDWDLERVYPDIRKGALSIEVITPSDKLLCREAFLEVLLCPRLMMDKKLFDLLSIVFKRRTPVENSDDVIAFFRGLLYIPSGFIVLCFHPAHVVRLWAHRTLKEACGIRPFHSISLRLVFSKILQILRARLKLEAPKPQPVFGPGVPNDALWHGFSTLLSSLNEEVFAKVCRHSKYEVLYSTFIAGLKNLSGESVIYVVDCLEVFIKHAQQPEFVTGMSSRNGLLNVTFQVFHLAQGHTKLMRRLLNLVSVILKTVQSVASREDTQRTYEKCFEFFKSEVIRPSTRGSGNHAVSFQSSDMRTNSLKSAASFFIQFYSFCAPNLPFNDPHTIGEFVLSIVREGPQHTWTWDLLRTVLLTDVFNIVRCSQQPEDFNLFCSTFSSPRPDPLSFREEEKKCHTNILAFPPNSLRVMTFLSHLWNELFRGTLLSKVPCVMEVKIFLDVHCLVGMVDPDRVSSYVSDEDLDKVSFGVVKGIQVDKGRSYFSQCLRLIQSVVNKRLMAAMNQSSPCPWWKDIPFHATHLMSSENKNLATAALSTLVRINNLGNATFSGSQAKLVANIMRNNPGLANLTASGTSVSMRVIYALGKGISLRTYTRFFLWYRVLVDCNYDDLLEKCGSSKWIVGVFNVVFDSWKEFEEKSEVLSFNEFCVRCLSNLRDLWMQLYSSARTSPRGGVDKQTELASRWHKRMISGLLDMHMLKEVACRSAWAHTVATVASTFSKNPEPRDQMMGIISFHAKDRSRLTFEQCRMLSEQFQLKEANKILESWAEDERRKELAERKTPPSSQKKKLIGTKIDSFFHGSRGPLQVQKLLTKQPSVQKTKPSSSVSLVSKFVKPALKPQPSGALATSKKVQKPVPARETANASGPSSAMNDLKKMHRTEQQERVANQRKMNPSSSVPVRPQKTKFELLREEAAEKRRKNEEEKRKRKMQKMDPANQGSPKDDGIADAVTPAPVKPAPKVEEVLHVPENRRQLDPSSVEDLNWHLLSPTSTFDQVEWRYGDLPTAFDDVRQYCFHWQPLLVEEFRSSLESCLQEEIRFAKSNCVDGRYKGCRTLFMNESGVECIGNIQKLTLKQCEDPGNHDRRSDRLTSDYDVGKLKPADILVLDCSECVLPGGTKPSAPSLGIAVSVGHKRGEVSVVVHTAFPSADRAPGKGRKVRVSRLTNIITFRRQLDALWKLPLMPDGLLWPLLEPFRGLEMNKKMLHRIEEKAPGDLEKPYAFVDMMRRKRRLNKSQANAINGVLNACQSTFITKDLPYRSIDQHGGMTLIQGPPGTGKTSTIISLLSTVLFNQPARMRVRKMRVNSEQGSVTKTLPPVRVLVCAPSNAAVDEIMLRVVEDGLWTSTGEREKPFIARVGTGTTVEALEAYEVRQLANCNEDSQKDKKDGTKDKIGQLLDQMQSFNSKIGKASDERNAARKKLQDLEQSKENADKNKKKDKLETEIRECTKRLTSLHDQKSRIGDQLTKERGNKREEEDKRRENDQLAIFDVLSRASIVFATLNSAGNDIMQELGGNFQLIIVDEAAQCCEPDILIPLSIGPSGPRKSNTFPHLVMVGDPKQLPATVLSTKRSVSKNLGRSFFERISEVVPDSVFMLDTQYRMHPSISTFPSQQFYRGLLQDGENVKMDDMKQPYHDDLQHRFGPLTFLDSTLIPTRETPGPTSSLFNLDEAKIIVSTLSALAHIYSEPLIKGKVVVLSPYREQVTRLKRMIADSMATQDLGVEVSTIDGIQGREKSIVILSTVRGSNAHSIGFVQDVRRMNVAITRAKHSLLVVGNSAVLAKHSLTWKSFIEHCRRENRLVELPSNSFEIFPELSHRNSNRNQKNRNKRQGPVNDKPSKSRKTAHVRSTPKSVPDEQPRAQPRVQGAVQNAPTLPSRKRVRSPPSPVPQNALHSKKRRVEKLGEGITAGPIHQILDSAAPSISKNMESVLGGDGRGYPRHLHPERLPRGSARNEHGRPPSRNDRGNMPGHPREERPRDKSRLQSPAHRQGGQGPADMKVETTTSNRNDAMVQGPVSKGQDVGISKDGLRSEMRYSGTRRHRDVGNERNRSGPYSRQVRDGWQSTTACHSQARGPCIEEQQAPRENGRRTRDLPQERRKEQMPKSEMREIHSNRREQDGGRAHERVDGRRGEHGDGVDGRRRPLAPAIITGIRSAPAPMPGQSSASLPGMPPAPLPGPAPAPVAGSATNIGANSFSSVPSAMQPVRDARDLLNRRSRDECDYSREHPREQWRHAGRDCERELSEDRLQHGHGRYGDREGRYDENGRGGRGRGGGRRNRGGNRQWHGAHRGRGHRDNRDRSHGRGRSEHGWRNRDSQR